MKTKPTLRPTWHYIIVGACALTLSTANLFAQARKPNILVIWGDDIGLWNVGAYSQGMMGKTPNIDHIGREAIEKLRHRPDLKNDVEFYAIDLSFKKLNDPSRIAYFLSLPTTFNLSDKVVDELKAAAHTLLHQNPDFQRLMADLKASRSVPPAPTTRRDVDRK